MTVYSKRKENVPLANVDQVGAITNEGRLSITESDLGIPQYPTEERPTIYTSDMISHMPRAPPRALLARRTVEDSPNTLDMRQALQETELPLPKAVRTVSPVQDDRIWFNRWFDIPERERKEPSFINRPARVLDTRGRAARTFDIPTDIQQDPFFPPVFTEWVGRKVAYVVGIFRGLIRGNRVVEADVEAGEGTYRAEIVAPEEAENTSEQDNVAVADIEDAVNDVATDADS
ncbi:uncharacterized protein LY89DRAFT_736016 [Mollisia scopiformis]|uniref:Uncharacterized protein n=1 Tax=Mollisia scopiformis TaxID=149040 RepID=A0A194X448_MOLSC|nr:uncharacterized protein LY89DRAFT_736016 [Mollisia scopiformis]KUJ14958.1 hypothetical protein LY89DRAFT_736016 [Mollisia scopiformis]